LWILRIPRDDVVAASVDDDGWARHVADVTGGWEYVWSLGYEPAMFTDTDTDRQIHTHTHTPGFRISGFGFREAGRHDGFRVWV
jgi:hypothetical protein